MRQEPLEAKPSTPGRIGLAVASLDGAGDGIAYVARLLNEALSARFESAAAIVNLGATSATPVSRWRRALFAARLARAQARGVADLWLYNHIGVARVQSLIPRSLGKPYAVMLNGIEAWDPALDQGRKAVIQNAVLRLAISNHTRERVLAVHPELAPIHTCLLALLPQSQTLSTQLDTSLLESLSEPYAVIVGRMSASERYKGHDQVLDAWPSVLERVPNANFVVVGRGDDSGRLRDKAIALGLNERVRFTGFVSDMTLEALLERATMFVMPSAGEGFGLVYLQAMRVGIPCIGSDEDAAADLIQHGITGFLVNRNDEADLAARIVELFTNEPLCRRLGSAGRQRFLNEFTFARFCDRLQILLCAAIAERTR